MSISCPTGTQRNGLTKCYKCGKGVETCTGTLGAMTPATCFTGYTMVHSPDIQCTHSNCDAHYIQGSVRQCVNYCSSNSYYININIMNYGVLCTDDCLDENGVQYFMNMNYKECFSSCDFTSYTTIGNSCFDLCPEEYPENDEFICQNCVERGLYNHNGKCVEKVDGDNSIFYQLTGTYNEDYGIVGSCFDFDEFGDYYPKAPPRM
jgi:hypothetical protein